MNVGGSPSLITEEKVNDTLVRSVYLQILRGRDGRDGVPGRDGVKGERGDKGEKGEKGETGPVGQAGPKSGGVVYTCWGRKSCPTGAQLLYEGIAGGSSHRIYSKTMNMFKDYRTLALEKEKRIWKKEYAFSIIITYKILIIRTKG